MDGREDNEWSSGLQGGSDLTNIMATERDPLLQHNDSLTRRVFGASEEIKSSASSLEVDVQTLHAGDNDVGGESFDNVPQEKRQLGLVSAVFLIFNRIVGTGIYATPSVILSSCGSIGFTFVVWIIGSLIAAAGTAVYIELGTGLPKSGGEKNYLEFIYRRPKYMATCCFAMFALFIAQSAANSVIFGEYVLHAMDIPATPFLSRLIAVLVLTVALLLHGTHLRNIGLRVQNALGVFTLATLSFIALVGLASAVKGIWGPGGGAGGDEGVVVGGGALERWWQYLWAGTRLDANGFVTALYNVIWSYIGYSNANYALSEVRDPVRTLRRAAPLAVGSVTVVYLLVNVAYFVVVPLEEVRNGGRIVAALFFRHVFGANTERLLSLIVAISVLGNVLAVSFAHGRIIQELGREGILPFSSFFASNQPFDAPTAALFSQWLICCITATAPPPGDAFNFILNLSSYPYTIINTLVALGVLILHWSSSTVHQAKQAILSPSRWAKNVDYDWSPPFRAWTSAVVFFLLANVFLAVVPLVPPEPGKGVYEHLPYWLHVPICFVIVLFGALYWYVWGKVLPRRGGYKLVRESVIQEDGVSRQVFRKVKDGGYLDE